MAAAVLGLIVVVALAGVWSPPIAVAKAYRDLAEHAGREFHIDPDLVLAVIAIESGGNPAACSHAGARGLMQLMPATAAERARDLGLDEPTPVELLDARLNIRLGTAHLRWLADRLGAEHPRTILAAYNAGIGTVKGWQERIDAPPTAAKERDAALYAMIDYPETRAYVVRVLDARRALASARPAPSH